MLLPVRPEHLKPLLPRQGLSLLLVEDESHLRQLPQPVGGEVAGRLALIQLVVLAADLLGPFAKGRVRRVLDGNVARPLARARGLVLHQRSPSRQR